jgi:type IV pilus assembly protein PilQ
VLVDNGGTVVIGGIYEQAQSNTTNKIPVLGDLPYVGFLFKQNQKLDDKSELLVFITPRILKESLSLR